MGLEFFIEFLITHILILRGLFMTLEFVKKNLEGKTNYSEESLNDLAKEIFEIKKAYDILCSKVSKAMIDYDYANEKMQDLQFYLDNDVFKCIGDLMLGK